MGTKKYRRLNSKITGIEVVEENNVCGLFLNVFEWVLFIMESLKKKLEKEMLLLHW